MFKQIVVAGLVLGLAACASEPPRRHGLHRGPPPSEGGPRRGVFISPSGEPFRGGEGLKAWFEGADADRDGALTLAEFQADALRFFRVVDANHDGVIDGFEVSAYEQTIAPEIAMLEFDRPGFGAGEDGPRGALRGDADAGSRLGAPGRWARGGDRGPRGRFALINEPEPVANADGDLDGKITTEEWKRAAARRFAVLDKARSGRLTLAALEGRAPPKP